MNYTADNYKAQRSIAEKHLEVENKLLADLDKLTEDVRENHRRTITMRIDHWTKRIAELDAKLAA